MSVVGILKTFLFCLLVAGSLGVRTEPTYFFIHVNTLVITILSKINNLLGGFFLLLRKYISCFMYFQTSFNRQQNGNLSNGSLKNFALNSDENERGVTFRVGKFIGQVTIESKILYSPQISS